MGDRHRLIYKGQSRCHDDEVGQHRIDDQHNAALVLSDLPHYDRRKAPPTAAVSAARWPRLSSADPGRSTTKTPKSPIHRHPTPQFDLLAQDRDREDGDKQRGREKDRVDLGKRQRRKSEEGRNTCDDRRPGPERRPPRMARPQVSRRAVAHQHDRDQRETQENAEENDLNGEY